MVTMEELKKAKVPDNWSKWDVLLQVAEVASEELSKQNSDRTVVAVNGGSSSDAAVARVIMNRALRTRVRQRESITRKITSREEGTSRKIFLCCDDRILSVTREDRLDPLPLTVNEEGKSETETALKMVESKGKTEKNVNFGTNPPPASSVASEQLDWKSNTSSMFFNGTSSSSAAATTVSPVASKQLDWKSNTSSVFSNGASSSSAAGTVVVKNQASPSKVCQPESIVKEISYRDEDGIKKRSKFCGSNDRPVHSMTYEERLHPLPLPMKERDNFNTEMPLEKEKRKREKEQNVDAGSNQSPDMSIRFKIRIREMNGGNLILVIEKALYKTDVSRSHCRLSIPVKQIGQEFLTEQEMALLNQKSEKNSAPSEIAVKLIEPSHQESSMKLKIWEMTDKKNKKKISLMYVLVGGWNSVVERNRLKKGDVVRLWSFRDGLYKLCFALAIVQRSAVADDDDDDATE